MEGSGVEISFSPGANINGYIIIKKIGGGGFADIYLVHSVAHDMDFAAKVIRVPPETIAASWKSFNSEVNALKVLDHPNIIRLYNHFQYDRYFVLILEFCSGGSLQDQVLANGPFTDAKLISFTRQIVNALSYSHSSCIAHHDLKPQNILFDQFGRPKLADFGISIQMSSYDLVMNYQCSVAFAAPEQLSKKLFDPYKSDIWSLGITLFFAATGVLPFTSRNRNDIIQSITEGLLYYPNELSKDYKCFLTAILRTLPVHRPHAREISSIIDDFFPNQINPTNSNARILPVSSSFLHIQKGLVNLSNKKGLRKSMLQIKRSHIPKQTFVDSIVIENIY